MEREGRPTLRPAASAGFTPAGAPDVIVVGDGLIGLACAVAAAEAGLRVRLVGAARGGQASHAAAGMLAPGVERAGGAAHALAVRARDRYPSYVAWLHERTGLAVPLDRGGILQLARDDAHAAALRSDLPDGARWLDTAALAALEPALAPAPGALLHPHDGSVDNRRLLAALGALADAHPRLARAGSPATAVSATDDEATVRTADGGAHVAARVVIAAGAWTPTLAGLPRALPVAPVRGQMLAVAAAPLGHVVYGGGGYAVPRGATTLVGSTMEHVAFDAGTTGDGLLRLRACAASIAPALGAAATAAHWAGLRPVTPDGLPIVGPDPEAAALVYACGHSRNGILLAPLTGDVVAALLTGVAPPASLAPYAVERFAAAASA